MSRLTVQSKTKAHDHVFVQAKSPDRVKCSICGFEVSKELLRRFVDNPHSLQITPAQREQLRPLLTEAP